MTADYNGWNDAREAEREALDLYFDWQVEQEVLAVPEEVQVARLLPRTRGSRFGSSDLRPAA